MNTRQGVLAGVLTASMVTCACGGGTQPPQPQTTSPSPVAAEGTSLSSFGGTWTSGPDGGAASANSCTGVQWRLPMATGSTGTGTFSATCSGIPVSGTVTVAMSRASLAWRVAGRAVGRDGQPCPFSLSGTATMERAGGMRVDYTGTVCGTPVSGSDVWRKP